MSAKNILNDTYRSCARGVCDIFSDSKSFMRAGCGIFYDFKSCMPPICSAVPQFVPQCSTERNKLKL